MYEMEAEMGMHSQDGLPAEEGHSQRWLVEIERWDWALGLGIVPGSTPEEAKFHGELMYTRGVDIRGRVVAPRSERGKSIAVSLSPTRVDYWSGPDAFDEVGQFNAYLAPLNGRDFGASILIPEDSLSNVLACLSSVWRYIHLWTIDPLPRASIQRASFSREVHENLQPWIDGIEDGLF